MKYAKTFRDDAHWDDFDEGFKHKVLPIIVRIVQDTDAENPLEPTNTELACKVEYAHYMNAAEKEAELTAAGLTWLRLEGNPYNKEVPAFLTLTDEAIQQHWAGKWGDAVLYLQAVAKNYRMWANNEVYGYQVTVDGEEIDSCWGFYGNSDAEDAAYDAFDPLGCLKFSVPFPTTVFNPATNRDEPLNDIRFWWIKWLEQRFNRAKLDKDWRWLDVFYRWHHDWCKDLQGSHFEHLEGYHRDYGKPAVWFPPHEVPIKYPLVFDWWMVGLAVLPDEPWFEWRDQKLMAAYSGITLPGDQLREMMQPSLMFDLGGEGDEEFLTRHMNNVCVTFTCKNLNEQQ